MKIVKTEVKNIDEIQWNFQDTLGRAGSRKKSISAFYFPIVRIKFGITNAVITFRLSLLFSTLFSVAFFNLFRPNIGRREKN